MATEEGTISKVLDAERFGRNNEYVKRGYVLDVPGKYPKQIYFEVFGQDKIENMALRVGSKGEFSLDIKSREWVGHNRWITMVACWKFVPADKKPQDASDTPSYAATAPSSEQMLGGGFSLSDDVPF